MASVSKLKKILDELRFKYQEKKTKSNLIERYDTDSLLEEILEDIQKIDSYCHDRNRY